MHVLNTIITSIYCISKILWGVVFHMSAPKRLFIFYNSLFFMVDRKSLRTKTFSQNTIYMFCLYHFSLKSIIKKIIYRVTIPLKEKNSNLVSTNVWSSFLMSQKSPTMSQQQEATASSTSSLIWGLKEFTKVVESPTRPRSSLSCFETTPSI